MTSDLTIYADVQSGALLGAYLGSHTPPANSIEVPTLPEDARHCWNGVKWQPPLEVVLEAFKEMRKDLVSRIRVTSSLGRTFDGDEVSTTRMLKPIEVLKHEREGATVLWVLSDNTPAQVGLEEFREVLKLAGIEQTKLWVPPETINVQT